MAYVKLEDVLNIIRNENWNFAGLIKHIEEHCPTADVAEVVECKDCKHYCLDDFREPDKPRWCKLSREQNEYPNPDDFCSYGERKDA